MDQSGSYLPTKRPDSCVRKIHIKTDDGNASGISQDQRNQLQSVRPGEEQPLPGRELEDGNRKRIFK